MENSHHRTEVRTINTFRVAFPLNESIYKFVRINKK